MKAKRFQGGFFVVLLFCCLVLAAQAAEPSGLVVLFLLRKRPEIERFGCFVVWLFSGLVILLFVSRADARDTGAALLIRGGDGAALLIRGGGALGVETPAHEEGREAGVGRKAGWSGAVRKAGWRGAEEG